MVKNEDNIQYAHNGYHNLSIFILNSNKTALMHTTQNQSMAESFTLDENVV